MSTMPNMAVNLTPFGEMHKVHTKILATAAQTPFHFAPQSLYAGSLPLVAGAYLQRAP